MSAYYINNRNMCVWWISDARKKYRENWFVHSAKFSPLQFIFFWVRSRIYGWKRLLYVFKEKKRMIHSKRIIGLLWATVNMQIKSNEFKFVPTFRHSTRTNWGCKMHLCFIVMQCNLWTWDSSLELKSSFEWITSVLLVRTNFNCDYISTSSYQILLYDECARPYSFAI